MPIFSHLPKNLNWSIFKNATSQVGGRLFLSAARLLIAAIIIRLAGAEQFGEYVLLFSLIIIAECMTDFGYTDISVRNICQHPEDKDKTLFALIISKIFFSISAMLMLLVFIHLMNYSEEIIKAAYVASTSIFFQSIILYYRAIFRIQMQMEKDVLGEVLGVIFMIPLILYCAYSEATLVMYIASYVFSRFIYMLVVIQFGKKLATTKYKNLDITEIKKLLIQSFPLGLAGLAIVISDNLAPIVLAKYMDMQAVAYFSSSMRFLFPIIIVIQSISNAFYPVLASYWMKSQLEFNNTQQNALEISFIIGAGIFCFVNSSAIFLMSLLGEEMIPAAKILEFLSWIVLSRCITAVMAPTIIIANGQKYVLWLTMLSLISQVVALAIFVPEYGIYGAIYAYMMIEVIFGLTPVIILSYWLASVRMKWLIIFKILACAAVSISLARYLNISDTWYSGFIVGLSYLTLLFTFNIVSIEKLKYLLDNIKNRNKYKKIEINNV